ncbi:MAG TPA: hypothetical protein VLV31_08710 [Candidatus Acidoferrales bacterium]|nr:hypothetical protein [Candidatus Acidoferrales bacterium]
MTDKRPKIRLNILAISAAIFILLILTSKPATAQPPPVTSTVSLQYFTIQAQYPSIVLPGQNVQVSVQAVAKSSANLQNLVAQIFLVEGSNLQQLTSATIMSNQNIASGNTFSQNVQLSIPQDAPRTALFAEFTETVKVSYVNGYSYGNSYPYDYGCSYYTYSYYYSNQYYCYPYNSYSSNPSYSTYSTSDSGVSPLSYVNATTPEYTSLYSQYQSAQQQISQSQSQNQNLQQQINQLQQQNSQLQTQNQQLQQNLQNAQSSISQRESDNANLTSQLNNTNSTKTYLTYLVIGFGVIAIAMALLAGRRGGARVKKTQSVNPYASNYESPKEQQHQDARG